MQPEMGISLIIKLGVYTAASTKVVQEKRKSVHNNAER